MVKVILTHEIANYSDWKKVFDAGEPLRQQADFKTLGIYNSVDNSNLITIVGECPSAETFHKFLTNPNLKSDMEKAGVKGMPEIKVLNKI
jgi:hypothetical protein